MGSFIAVAHAPCVLAKPRSRSDPSSSSPFLDQASTWRPPGDAGGMVGGVMTGGSPVATSRDRYRCSVMPAMALAVSGTMPLLGLGGDVIPYSARSSADEPPAVRSGKTAMKQVWRWPAGWGIEGAATGGHAVAWLTAPVPTWSARKVADPAWPEAAPPEPCPRRPVRLDGGDRAQETKDTAS